MKRIARAVPMTQQLENMVAEALKSSNFELLEVQLQNPGKRPIVLVRVDRLDEQPVTIEDVHHVSSILSDTFDQLDPIAGEYRLEVESPGGKRPLLRARHFERMLGLKAKVRAPGHNFTGPIVRVEGDLVTFAAPTGEVSLRVGEFQANLAEFPPSHR